MELIGNNMSDEELKNKKIMKIIIILIAILLIVSIGIIGVIYYINKTSFKFTIDTNKISNYKEDLFVFNEDNVYISIKDMAGLVGYTAYNGSYGNQEQYSEDITKCYVESENEIASFELDSTKIYKISAKENNDYEYFNISEPIVQLNGKLYTTPEGACRAFNISFSYDKEKNQIIIYTLPYLVDYYSDNNKSIAIKDNFNNQKALLYSYLIVSNTSGTNNVRYGISTLSGTEIVGTKYKNIEFIESTEEFLVTTTEGKMGIITGNGRTKVQPQYDNLKQVDKDLDLYLATLNNKQGIIEKNGKILIYLEYDKIGIDSEVFKTNDIKNPYLLYGNCIPVCQNEKWGMYDKTGQLIIPVEYDSFGCIIDSKTINNANSILLIPEIKGIVVSNKYDKDRKLYGIFNYKGKQIIPLVLDSVYSIISSGREEYSMTNAGNTFNILDYINENNIEVE